MALKIVRKFSLADVSDGWQDCYLLYTPASPRDVLTIDAMGEAATQTEEFKTILTFVKAHVRGGKGLGDDGQLVDLSPDDVELLPIPVVRDIFQLLSGASLDPKDTRTETETSSTPSGTPESSNT